MSGNSPRLLKCACPCGTATFAVTGEPREWAFDAQGNLTDLAH